MRTKLLIILFIVLSNSSLQADTNVTSYEFLNFTQVKELLSRTRPDPGLFKKLGDILNTVFFSIHEEEKKETSFKVDANHDREYLRVSQWNLENFDMAEFYRQFRQEGNTELELLRETDIFVLNNVGLNTEDSNFKNHPELLSKIFQSRYVFAAEFLEASPSLVELESLDKDFHGVRGNVILSKYPIKEAKILRLPACYDWFSQEAKYLLDEDPKKTRSKVKLRSGEGKLDLIRRGGRNAIVADLLLPNQQMITVVASQLENRATSPCRETQINKILYYIKNVSRPVVLGIDLNNFESSKAPNAFKDSMKTQVKDPWFWGKQAIGRLNPFGMFTSIASLTYGNYRKMGDPTVKNVPMLFRNKAYDLFALIADYKFADRIGFDFSGEHKLENSNERKNKGYVATYKHKGLFGTAKTKVDWLFVKPAIMQNQKHYFPYEAHTISSLSFSRMIDGKKSKYEHYPITVKLMI